MRVGQIEFSTVAERLMVGQTLCHKFGMICVSRIMW